MKILNKTGLEIDISPLIKTIERSFKKCKKFGIEFSPKKLSLSNFEAGVGAKYDSKEDEIIIFLAEPVFNLKYDKMKKLLRSVRNVKKKDTP